MTRETKIGLLVGLAFIIVIGILLSDHLTSSNEPPQATLAVAGNNVRSGVTTPGANGVAPVTTAVNPSPVSPQRTVPTPTDLQPRPQPVQPIQVAVGGPSNAPSNSHITSPVQPADLPSVQIGGTDRTLAPPANDTPINSEPVISRAPTPVVRTATNEGVSQVQPATDTLPIATNIQDAARQVGEELIPIGGIGNAGTPSNTLVSSRQAPVGVKQYVAVEGDSLGKIAQKLLGSSSKANRDAIINANPSLKQNSNLVVSGRTYNIPVIPGVTSGAPASAVGPSPSPVQVIQAPAPAAPAMNETWYTVKEGDSLWKIAVEQCGSPAAIQAIKDLNKTTLVGETVVLNTKLRLPGKVASAN